MVNAEIEREERITWDALLTFLCVITIAGAIGFAGGMYSVLDVLQSLDKILVCQ